MSDKNDITADLQHSRRNILQGISAGALATLTGTGLASAGTGEDESGRDRQIQDAQFRTFGDALDDARVLSDSSALATMRETILAETGKAVDVSLPLSVALESGDTEVDAQNPAFATALLKEPGLAWEEASPSDLGVAFAVVTDKPSDGVADEAAVAASDGTERLPVAATALSVADANAGSAEGLGGSQEAVTYDQFGYDEDGAVTVESTRGAAPDAAGGAEQSLAGERSELPDAVSQEVVESYRVAGTTQGIGDIGCITCEAIIPAICAGAATLGRYGCTVRCLPLTTSYPVLAGACGLFCYYVTTVPGASLCAASPAIICKGAFGC